MTASFGPEKVKQLLKEKEEKEQLQRQAELEKKRQAEEHEAAAKAAKEVAQVAARATANQPREQKERERGKVCGRFLNALIDWKLADLAEDIATGRVVPKLSNDNVVVSFVLLEESHCLAGKMRTKLIEWLTTSLQEEWDTVETGSETTCNPMADSVSQLDERHVGVRFTLTKRS